MLPRYFENFIAEEFEPFVLQSGASSDGEGLDSLSGKKEKSGNTGSRKATFCDQVSVVCWENDDEVWHGTISQRHFTKCSRYLWHLHGQMATIKECARILDWHAGNEGGFHRVHRK